MTQDEEVDISTLHALQWLHDCLQQGVSNDKAKYCMPEAYKTSLVMTINARSLQNFLELRSGSAALWEIRLLAQAIYDAIPDDHKYLFKECMQQEVWYD
jgi:thymidylate synthase (FAD)